MGPGPRGTQGNSGSAGAANAQDLPARLLLGLQSAVQPAVPGTHPLLVKIPLGVTQIPDYFLSSWLTRVPLPHPTEAIKPNRHQEFCLHLSPRHHPLPSRGLSSHGSTSWGIPPGLTVMSTAPSLSLVAPCLSVQSVLGQAGPCSHPWQVLREGSRGTGLVPEDVPQPRSDTQQSSTLQIVSRRNESCTIHANDEHRSARSISLPQGRTPCGNARPLRTQGTPPPRSRHRSSVTMSETLRCP